MAKPFPKWDACNTYLFIQAFFSFAFTLFATTNLIYQAVVVGLSPLQLVLVGTTLEIATFLFEIPTGVVADVYSRRLSVIIGYLLIGLGFMVEAVPTFFTVLLAQIIWGIGYTFTSGALDAWIVDEVGKENANAAFLRGSQTGQVAGFVGLWVAILLASIQLNLPHIVSGSILVVLSIVLIFVMPETGFQRVPAAERESWRDLFKTLGEGLRLIRLRRVLLMIVGTSLLVGLFSEGWDRLWTPHLLGAFGLPEATGSFGTIALFGVIGSVSTVLSLIVTEWIKRRNLQTHSQLSGALMIAYGVVGLGVIGFALAGHLVIALAALWLVGIARTVSAPLFMAWINNHTEANVRATVISVASQANAFGQIAGGPPIGLLGNRFGLSIAISIAGLMMLPTVWLAGRIRKQKQTTGDVVHV
ncbi:MAG: MFS transporter [Anaerolineae bacterium]|nr:MFS transporter [Anaerolineae bacterium]